MWRSIHTGLLQEFEPKWSRTDAKSYPGSSGPGSPGHWGLLSLQREKTQVGPEPVMSPTETNAWMKITSKTIYFSLADWSWKVKKIYICIIAKSEKGFEEENWLWKMVSILRVYHFILSLSKKNTNPNYWKIKTSEQFKFSLLLFTLDLLHLYQNISFC